nr:hypothetical protein [Tanacetum cinerariifolium]
MNVLMPKNVSGCWVILTTQSWDFEEEWMVNEKNDVDEASGVSVEEHNNLPSEEDSESLIFDRTIFVSEIDGIDVYPFSSDTEKPNDYTQLKL